jgi:hypothetical protein
MGDISKGVANTLYPAKKINKKRVVIYERKIRELVGNISSKNISNFSPLYF